MPSIELLFLGTGTSAGVPMIGCDCQVCTSSDSRDRRTRPSVVISYDSISVLVDTAPELRLQCIANGVRRIDAIVFTHAHADHIMGLDDVRRFNSIKGGALDVWADAATHAVLQRCFGYAFRADPALQLYRPHLVPRTIQGPFELGGQEWIPIPLVHGNVPVLGFRLGKLAYCTDVSSIPAPSMELLSGVELLVLDGLQHRKHPTHLTIDEAVQLSRQIGARQTYLTHIAHGVSHERTSRELPEGVELAYDGLRITCA